MYMCHQKLQPLGSINHGLTETLVGCPAERKGPLRKQETQTTKKTGTVTKTSTSRTNKAVEKPIMIMSGTWSPRTKEHAVRSCTRLSKARNVMAQEWLH